MICKTYDGFVRVPDQEYGGVVDLSVVVVLQLELAGHVSARARGVAVSFDGHHQSVTCRHSLAIETFLAEGDVVVHTASEVSRDSLNEKPQPSVARAGVAGQSHKWKVSVSSKLYGVPLTLCLCRPREVSDVQPELLLEQQSSVRANSPLEPSLSSLRGFSSCCWET